MGIDMSKMKDKLNKIQKKGGNSEVFWKPKDGEQTIRILPTADGDPFKEYWFHYNLGTNAAFLSPKKNYGEDCPLDNFVRSLYNEGTEDSVKMAKKLAARQRFFSPVIVRGEEDKGVRLWGYGKMAYQELLGLVLNPDYGDITDVEDGTDLVINYGKPAGAQFPQTNITPRRRSSPLTETEDLTNRLLDEVPNPDEVFEKKSHKEVQAMLDEYLLAADEHSSDESSVSTSASDSSQKSSVDEAFEELLG